MPFPLPVSAADSPSKLLHEVLRWADMAGAKALLELTKGDGGSEDSVQTVKGV
jgi:hypothetical protein